METGLLLLMGTISIHNNSFRKDSLTEQSPWDHGIIEAARRGCSGIVNDHYDGDALRISHVNKKANTTQHYLEQQPGIAFQHNTSLLSVACHEQGALCCSIALSAWLLPEAAVKSAAIAHITVADDYHAFTKDETNARAHLVALAAGALYELGLQWAPAPLPRTFAASEYFRYLAKGVVDRFERLPLAQYGISWLQYLITSGDIRVFDALIKIDK
ncbi:hypothetical protein BDW59DRAFT_164046 [Aspergillus cavernicola]|uniref:Uncharacterized protein n=1 Tax=Aspergillus cavernicola TaxID=176166 RepID=A0ABR4I1T9_9EURO